MNMSIQDLKKRGDKTMNKMYNIYVCDIDGKPQYHKKIVTSSLAEAENIAFMWSIYVENTEGWLTTYMADEIKTKKRR